VCLWDPIASPCLLATHTSRAAHAAFVTRGHSRIGLVEYSDGVEIWGICALVDDWFELGVAQEARLLLRVRSCNPAALALVVT
jgi:hypothetical protein